MTSDVHVVVPSSNPPRWSPRWGLLAILALLTLILLALVATWAVQRADDGAEPDTAASPEEGAAATTSAGTGVSAGNPSPPGSAATGSTPASTTTPPATNATTPAATATPATGTAGPATVPAGWVTYTDAATGYRIAHPPGWTVRAVDEVRVDFVDPATGAYMRVDWVQPPGNSAVEAWRSFAPRFAAANPGYQEIRIEPTTFRGLEAALWEFRYGEGGRLHAVDLGMISGRYGFALNFQAPETQWAALQDVRRGFESSFQPAS